MGSIKAFIVFSMTSLYLPIMPWCIGTDKFMSYPMLFQTKLEQGRFVLFRGETVGKLSPVICLDTLNGAGKGFHKVIHKKGGRVGAVFLKSFHKTPSGILVDSGILEELFSDNLTVYEAGGRDEFDIYLNTLTGMLHLLVGLGNILGIGRVYSHDALFFQEAVESGDGAGVTALHELDPEHHKPCVRVSSANIHNQLDFIGGMLVRMMVRSTRSVLKRLDRAIITPFPTVDILSVGFIFDSSLSNSIFISILNKG